MITLPDAEPGPPDLRSTGRYLAWLARRQWPTLAVAGLLGLTWTVAQAVVPAVIGRTIDAGVIGRDGHRLLVGTLILVGLGTLQSVTGVMRHRYAVSNWMQAALRTQQLVGHHVADNGPAVTGAVTTGEAVSTTATDAPRIADLYDVQARFIGAIASYVVIAALLLRIDLGLGALVLVGVPVLSASMAVLIRPLQARQARQREQEGRLTALGADTVAGLRVLRGIGGEAQFVARYRQRSQQVRAAGVGVATPQASLDLMEVLLPGAFVVVLTWLGARATLAGRLTPGELVAMYGYAAFLRSPLATATEMLTKGIRGYVAAGRVVRLLRTSIETGLLPGTEADLPPAGSELDDPATGLRIRPGRLSALVAQVPDQAAALADRLARLDLSEPAPRLGGVSLSDAATDRVRRRVLVSEAEPRLFSGTLRSELDPAGTHSDGEILAAVRVADAGDVLDVVPGGLDGQITERGRALSGGQRQRLVLARALLADPEVLVLVEPTSAVDAHTEARIAERLRAARAGRTTLVTTSSPLLLDRVDEVALLADGRVVAEGTHRELLHISPAYRRTVIRGEE